MNAPATMTVPELERLLHQETLQGLREGAAGGLGEVPMTGMAGEALTAPAVETIGVVAGWWQVGQEAIAPPYRDHPTISQTPILEVYDDLQRTVP